MTAATWQAPRLVTLQSGSEAQGFTNCPDPEKGSDPFETCRVDGAGDSEQIEFLEPVIAGS